jgi:hypothetical protein
MDASVSVYRVKSVEVSYQVAGRLSKAGDKGRPSQRCTILEEANLVAREPRPRAAASRVRIGVCDITCAPTYPALLMVVLVYWFDFDKYVEKQSTTSSPPHAGRSGVGGSAGDMRDFAL